MGGDCLQDEMWAEFSPVSADISPGQGGPRAQGQLDGLGWKASFCHLLAGDLGRLLGICA